MIAHAREYHVYLDTIHFKFDDGSVSAGSRGIVVQRTAGEKRGDELGLSSE